MPNWGESDYEGEVDENGFPCGIGKVTYFDAQITATWFNGETHGIRKKKHLN